MGNIVLLDELTINKIAAGEVIERPASVIKEMVENSIDAGATNITVEIKNGGISYIKVIDNGKGIAKDDLEIAFERHATSKIRSADDLDTVTSMGFRGEALASIAAIAKVELIAKTEQQEIGYKIVVEGGNVLEKEEAGCRTGTTITVKNLFFNTPVRYKFLKKDYTESGYIEDVITRIALVNPNIAIKLINTGKTVIQTNGNGDLKSVIYSIYGKDIANGIREVTYQYEDIQITGVVGKPEIARSNRSNQLFFVNKRYIKDKTLTAATEQAYKGLIPIGKFGFVVLNLKVNPAKVDVNVHPAKLEVRFQEENKIFQSIYHAIKDTLLKGELVANTEKTNVEAEKIIDRNGLSFEERLKNLRESKKENQNGGLFSFRKQNEKQIEKYTEEESKIKTNILEEREPNKKQEVVEPTQAVSALPQRETIPEVGQPINTADVLEQLRQMKEEMEEELKEKESTSNRLKEPEQEYKLEKEQEQNKEEGKQQEASENFQDMYTKLFGKVVTQPRKETPEEMANAVDMFKDNVSMFEEQEEFQKPNYKFIGIVFKTYIILEMDQEMYLLDQHAAHERIMYEKVKKNYYSQTTKDSQLLLLPDIITLTHKEMEIAKENMKMFEQAGFCLEEFGENTIKLTGVPTICIDLDTKELFLETLDEINTVARTAKQEKEEKFIATVACKAAVKANMALSMEEVQNLMEQLLKLPNPFTCPHGRPTAIKMTKYDIERKFARK
ncbi:MAG: DNA mismatch repair endonuclease MutL [Clostridia bacterium]|nr:DNA mismatch repair endonuclease MutL [Clostridia bacterium]